MMDGVGCGPSLTRNPAFSTCWRLSSNGGAWSTVDSTHLLLSLGPRHSYPDPLQCLGLQLMQAWSAVGPEVMHDEVSRPKLLLHLVLV